MKEWMEPQVFDLTLKETKGGPHYTPKSDGPAIYDEVTDKWWTPSGDNQPS